MTKQEVKEKMHEFMGFILKEKEIRERLLQLKLVSKDVEVLKKNIREQDRLIEEIDSMRKNEMLPLLEEIMKFVDRRRKEITAEKAARGEEMTEEEYYTMLADASVDLAQDEGFRTFLDELTPESPEE